MRVLFILKQKSYGDFYSYSYNGGLFNSAKLVVEMLQKAGVECKLVEVVDNNDIDREVYQYKPQHVIIEALWVVPDKFTVLQKLHPSVKWTVRIHSELPFLANEGIAIEWIKQYVTFDNVSVGFNSFETYLDFIGILDYDFTHKIIYLPNYYPIKPVKTHKISRFGQIDIGCFGAIRPFKNQLVQAVAAMQYADKHGKILYFHINGGRKEQFGENNYRNIVALFEGTKHQLLEYTWMDHEPLLELIGQMDLNMAVSLTESFCITAADSVVCRTPLVCSSQVKWASSASQVNDPTSVSKIVETMERVLGVWSKLIRIRNLRSLSKFSSAAKKRWLEFLK